MRYKDITTENQYGWKGVLGAAEDMLEYLDDKAAEITGVSNWKRDGTPTLTLFDRKAQSMRMWTRGDGSKYKEPGHFTIAQDKWDYLTQNKKNAAAIKKVFKTKEQAMEWAWDQITQLPKAKEIGDVSDVFGSSEFAPAVSIGPYIFIKRGTWGIQYATKGILRNSAIWRQQQKQ